MMRFNHTHWGVSCRPRHFLYPMSGFFQHRHILFSVVRPTLGPPVSILTKPYLKSLWKTFDDIFSMNTALFLVTMPIMYSWLQSNMNLSWRTFKSEMLDISDLQILLRINQFEKHSQSANNKMGIKLLCIWHWIGKNVWKTSERMLKHTPVWLFGNIIGN